MSANVGGYIRGPWWRYTEDEDNAVRRCFVAAWGNIVREPEEKFKDMRSVRFAIKTGRGAGRSEKYLLCVGYGERISSTVMRAMEKGDVVFCAGTWVEKAGVKTKKGIRPIYEMQVNFIIPMELVGFLLDLYSADKIQKIVEDYKNDDADVWES